MNKENGEIYPQNKTSEDTPGNKPEEPLKSLEGIEEKTKSPSEVSNENLNPLDKSADTIKNINTIKEELCKLPLNPCELDYINNNIAPLLNVLYQLSTTSYNLSNSASVLSISSIVHPKRHELKETIRLTYKINESCEDVYQELKKRLKIILDYS